jgi:hypothetical protein
MALLPKVKLKAVLSFPSAILDGAGIDVTRVNGAFRFDLAYDDFAPPVTGVADPAHTNALLWNSATDTYVLAPVSVLGSAGTVPEAPSDGVQYGRQSNTWTPVSTGSTIPPATVPPLMDGAAAVGTTTKYAREDHVHPSDTSRAATIHSHVAANVTDFSEAVDDRVAGLLVAGSNITLTYDDPGNTLTVASTAPGLADGDKGDITVTGSGTTWTIDPNTVSNAKLAQMPLFTIKANNTGFSAVPTDINIASLTTKTPAGADYLLLSDTTASGALKKTLISALPGGTSIGEAPTDGAVYARQGSSASWVIAGGFPDGNKGDVTITSSGTVWTINADAVTFAKIQNIATDSLIGRDTAGTGDPENITLGASLSMSGAQVLQRAALTGDVTATVDSNATTIANGTVTLAKMANLTAPVFVGRTTPGAGVPEALTPTQATAMLNVFASSLKGLVPSPAGATTTFLQADGTWATPVDSTKVAKAGDTMTGPLTQFGSGHWQFQSPGAGSFYSSISTPDRFFAGTDVSADVFRIFSSGPAANALIVDGPTGRVTVAVDPTDPLGVATKQYVDAGDVASAVAGLAAAGMQINGGFDIDQPNAGAVYTIPATNGTGKLMDCWTYNNGSPTTAAYTAQQTTSVFPGFNKELKLTVTAAQASVGSTSFDILHYIEGYRIARLAPGTASAKSVTVAFWVKSSIAGILPVSVYSNGFLSGTPSSVTITSANVAQYVSTTVQVPTSGTWLTDNGLGMIILIRAMATSFNIAATNGNTLEITGVTVLPGTQAPTAAQSPLIMRSYDQELVMCQRYYWRNATGVDDFFGSPRSGNSFDNVEIFYPATMRIAPTLTVLWEDATAGSVVRSGFRSCWLQSTNVSGSHYVNNFKADARL